jgi:hypothetical protein
MRTVRHVQLVMRAWSCLLFAALACGGCRHDLGNGDGDGDGGTSQRDDLAGVDGLFCVSQMKQVDTVGVDLVFLIDTSYSMDFNLKWESVAAALRSFVQNPAFHGVGVGLQYFPSRSTCDSALYQTLDAPIDVLPTASTALIASIDRQMMAGGTPTVPAMDGVLQMATARALANPDRRVVVVFATDGVPDDSCPAGALPNTIPSVVQLVQGAANATPKVITFVVGVGSELTALDAIAVAGGGTPKALLVDTTQNVTASFANALDQVRKIALTCEFTIPAPEPGLAIDFDQVNVVFTTTSAKNLVYVGSKAGCAKAPTSGWYYDDANKPTRVILCDEVCDSVRNSNSGRVDIQFGCARLVP